jgi:hypothetical protein
MMDKRAEDRARRQLRSLGYALKKDRRRNPELRTGGYMIVDPWGGPIPTIIVGENFDPDLADVAAFVAERKR